MSLRLRITILLILGALIFCGSAVVILKNYMDNSLNKILIEQGRIFTSGIANSLSENLSDNRSGETRKILNQYSSFDNIEYILIEDSTNQIKFHTFVGDIPLELFGGNVLVHNSSKDYALKQIILNKNNERISISDFVVPLNKNYKGYLRVGLSDARMTERTEESFWIISAVLGSGALLFITIVFLLITQQITKPIIKLTQIADNMSLGKLDYPVKIDVKNELQILAFALDRMRESLKTCLEKMEARPFNRF
jgi:HAMP domain-containing protein